MERDKAMQKYREETTEILVQYRERMGKHLLEQSAFLEEQIQSALRRLGEKMEQQQKEYVSFLTISILKVDLIHRNYRFLLHAMNHLWYLDEESIEIYFEARNLFHPFDEVWDNLTEISRTYIRVINSYDIQNIMFEELKPVDRMIAQILRYRLRNWEEKGIFSGVTLTPYWLLKWGDYRDRSGFVLQTDRVRKDKDAWKQEIKKAFRKPETMVFSYWYQGEYEGSRLEHINTKFIVFEEARLTDIVFEHCDMEGSRFLKSHLSGCRFEHCNLWGADFTGCTLEQVSFSGSELTGAILPAESIPFLNLEPEQLQVVLLK